VDERSERVARRFEVPMLVASALVIPALILEGSDSTEALARALNYAIWVAFLTEAVVMLAVVPDRRRWARTHPLELVVVVFTPPFLGGILQSLRVLRLLRLLRLFRLAPLVRRIFTVEGVRDVGLLAVLFLVAGAEAYHHFEDGSFGEAIYWAVGQMTTAGGDLQLNHAGTRVVASVLAVTGVGFVAILTGAIAQRFLAPAVSEIEAAEAELEAEEHFVIGEVRDIAARLTRLEEVLERRAGRG
jgi:voltage-gated potassium channel